MKRARCIVDIVPRFKPGDLPPTGYLEWHEWADVQRKAKIRQTRCACGKWITPQEKIFHQHSKG